MKKAILTSFSILCLSFILFVMEYKIPVNADTTVIYVPTQYATIQEAVDNANPGDTIIVKKNITYYEHVVVNKSVSLIGEDRDSTIIDGKGRGSVISVTASNVSIHGFTMSHSGLDTYDSAITIDHSSGNNISYNKIHSNFNGISLSFSSNNVISNNEIYKNINAINLYSSSSNAVSSNAIYVSTYGIYLTFSINNTIYHNNFNNTRQAWGSDLKNIWDYEGEGNYWSNYNGTDIFRGAYQNETGSDGIGDTKYVIDTNNRDNYPLMGRFSDFNVILKRKAYHVTVISNSTISDFRFEVGNETGNKIIRFNATGDSKVGFSRVSIPTELMSYPFIVLVGEEEVIPTFQNVSKGKAYLYFTYIHSSSIISIISSKTLYLYNELLDKHVKLQTDLNNLNATYHDFLNNYSVLLGNYSQLQKSYRELNSSYQEHLLNYSENVHNIRNLVYIFAATTAIFIITTIYLSKSTHPPFNRLIASADRHTGAQLFSGFQKQ